MAKIVLAWELGEGLGHIQRLDALARALLEANHAVTLALTRPEALNSLYPGEERPSYAVLVAPTWPTKPTRLSREPANMAEILLAIGYHNSQKLHQYLIEWRTIFAALKPDLIIYDYAPTAELASRDYPGLTISLDDPFTRPPDLSPLPAFDASISQQNLMLSEHKIVAAINQALVDSGLTKIHSARDIFHGHTGFLLSIPELDPFAESRKGSQYIGPFNSVHSHNAPLEWSTEPSQKRIFAYLKPNYPALPELLRVLAAMAVDLRIFLPGAGDELLSFSRDIGLSLATAPYDLSDLGPCDLAICHGGHSTTLQAVLQGVPLLLIPLQQEQLCTARAAIKAGFALGLGPRVTDRQKITSLLQRLLSEPGFGVRAKACAATYRTHLRKPALTVITDYLETLL